MTRAKVAVCCAVAALVCSGPVRLSSLARAQHTVELPDPWSTTSWANQPVPQIGPVAATSPTIASQQLPTQSPLPSGTEPTAPSQRAALPVESVVQADQPPMSAGTEGLPGVQGDVPQNPFPDRPGIVLSDGRLFPLTPPPGAEPPPPPLPNMPPPAGMGALPGPAPVFDPSGSLQQFIQDKLTVTIRGGGKLRFYGFLRGDFDVATNRFNDIQNPFFVLPNNGAFRQGANNLPIVGNNPNYSLYPRLTRFGAEYFGEPIDALDGTVASGVLEIDFLTINPLVATVPNNESRQLLRLRLAYAQLQHENLKFVIGQDWDLASPLLPTINDNTLMWNAGNLGDRRPQMKLLYDWHITDPAIIQIQNGAWLAGAIDNNDLDGNGALDSEDRIAPGWQWRVGLLRDSWVKNQKIIAGVSGAFAEQRVATPLGLARRNHFNTEMIGLDLRVPIIEGLTFQGECYTGQNLDDLRGGSGQGINPFLGREVRASGGWCELVARPCRYYQTAVGVTTDNPVNNDVTGLVIGPNQNAGRTNQLTWYMSNRFPLGRGLLIGADYLNWATDWQTYGRAHSSLFKFFLQQNF